MSVFLRMCLCVCFMLTVGTSFGDVSSVTSGHEFTREFMTWGHEEFTKESATSRHEDFSAESTTSPSAHSERTQQSPDPVPVTDHVTDDNLTEVWEILEEFLQQDYHPTNRTTNRHTSKDTTDSKVFIQNTEFPEFKLKQEHCPPGSHAVFNASRGVVTGQTWPPSNNRTLYKVNADVRATTYCTWSVNVPEEQHLSLAVQLGSTFCKHQLVLEVRNIQVRGKGDRISCFSHKTQSQAVLGKVTAFLYLTAGSQFHFQLKYWKHTQMESPPIHELEDLLDFQLLFLATKQPLLDKLRVVASSRVSGYITAPGYGLAPTPLHMDASYVLHLPADHSLLLSFARLVLHARDVLTLSELHTDGSSSVVWKKNRLQGIKMYTNSIRIGFQPVYHSTGFQLHYSFHPHSLPLPQKLNTGLFNCSVPHYPSFQQHLHCNLERECEGGEDEGGHCPFSSPACDGHVAVADKCYVLHRGPLSWRDAQGECKDNGGQLAVIRSKHEEDVFFNMLRVTKKQLIFFIGLTLRDVSSNLYRHTLTWADNTIAYTAANVETSPAMSLRMFAFHTLINYFHLTLDVSDVVASNRYPFVCEHVVEKRSVSDTSLEQHLNKLDNVSTTPLIDRFSGLNLDYINKLGSVSVNLSLNGTHESSPRSHVPSLSVCPAGYMTNDFLQCDLEAACQAKQYQGTCPLAARPTHKPGTLGGSSSSSVENSLQVDVVDMFRCDSVGHTFPYTLVCNFVPDCSDGSDESFCQYATCADHEHRCGNGQCVDLRLRNDLHLKNITCDRVTHCNDGFDEIGCQLVRGVGFRILSVDPPARIDFSELYIPTATALDNPHTCPDTHFSCPGNFGYCLPVNVRCNNYYDCPYHQDEAGCENYVCPGFYRCRGSSICLHVSHVCDGVAQCPGREDEMLCELSCPSQCRCQGLAFVCSQPFPAARFPQLRYLDASHSLMDFGHLPSESLLVWLSLRGCRLKEVSPHTFVNLQILDLRQNRIETISVDVLGQFPNLVEIYLSENPLASITSGKIDTRYPSLRKFDFAMTRLSEFDCDVFEHFPEVSFLNLSHCNDVRITRGFVCFPYLTEIDIRGTHIQGSQLSLFEGLGSIEMVFSDDYRHCCPGVLPDVSQNLFCFTPSIGYSSCSDLLGATFHRVFLWMLALISFTGTAGAVLAMCRLQKKDNLESSPVEKGAYVSNTLGKNNSASNATETEIPGTNTAEKENHESNPMAKESPESNVMEKGNVTSHMMDVFIVNLVAANVLMGVHLCVILVADITFRGEFLWHEREWALSLACKTASFLAVVPSEVSCFTVLLLSVDRLVALCFPSHRLQRKSAWILCILSWFVAVLLALVPLLMLPASSLKVGEATNLCIPVPGVSNHRGHAHAFGVLIVLNPLLAVGTAVCLTVVYRTVRTSYVITSTKDQLSVDMTLARRLTSLMVTDAIYWVALGTVGILAPAGGVAEGVVTAMVVYGLPLKPVLNPVLYVNAVLTERRRLKGESRLLRLLERRVRSHTGRTPLNTSQHPLMTSSTTSPHPLTASSTTSQHPLMTSTTTSQHPLMASSTTSQQPLMTSSTTSEQPLNTSPTTASLKTASTTSQQSLRTSSATSEQPSDTSRTKPSRTSSTTPTQPLKTALPTPPPPPPQTVSVITTPTTTTSTTTTSNSNSTTSTTSTTSRPLTSREDVLSYLRQCLHSHTLRPEDGLALLQSSLP